MKKRFYHIGDLKQRWLDNDAIITLKVKQITARNIEFIVNGNSDHIVWYSQLSRVFLNIKTFDLVLGDIKFKNGEKKIIAEYEPEKFAKSIKDKRFRVIANADGLVVAKFDEHNTPPCTTYGEAAEFIRQLVENGEIDKAADYLQPATIYDLEEV